MGSCPQALINGELRDLTRWHCREMDARLQALLADQSGTVARAQLVFLGMADHEIRRLVRRRDLTRVHRGVFVNHTGEPTWLQQAWCAILATSSFDDGEPTGSALRGLSALRLIEGPGSPFAVPGQVQIAICASRFVREPENVEVERCRHFVDRLTHRMGIPCVRYEDALIDVAGGLGRWE